MERATEGDELDWVTTEALARVLMRRSDLGMIVLITARAPGVYHEFILAPHDQEARRVVYDRVERCFKPREQS